MKSRTIGALLTAGLTAGLMPGLVVARGAERVDLIHNGSFSCEGGALEGVGSAGEGFAVIISGSPGRLMAQVQLRGGLANTSYSVRLIQSAGLGGSIADCNVQDATLITDSRGDGHVRIREALGQATVGAFVFLVHFAEATSPLDIHGTRLVAVS